MSMAKRGLWFVVWGSYLAIVAGSNDGDDGAYLDRKRETQ